jgi:hypothetical protein
VLNRSTPNLTGTGVGTVRSYPSGGRVRKRKSDRVDGRKEAEVRDMT